MSSQSSDRLHVYCGRAFTPAEIDLVSTLCQRLPTRKDIALELCQLLDWHDLRGQPKFVSASVILSRMQRDGLVQLPSPRNHNRAPSSRWPLFLPPDPSPPEIACPLSKLRPLRLRPVSGTAADSRLFNRLLAQHHYLGYRPLAGAQRRYFVEAHDHTILALFWMAAAAWTCEPRDDFIDWTDAQRRANLHLVVANSRFLVLPWVRVPHLASAALALLARSIGPDWEQTYGFRPALLETFVERGRFRGTSYRAANWIWVGRTQGRGKLDVHKRSQRPIKDIYLYPLGRNFRHRLTA